MTPRICGLAVLFATFVSWSVSPAFGQTVRFDAPGFIEGRELDDADFHSLHPNERLVEFGWEIAANFGDSADDRASALLIRLHTMQSDVTIVDYCPRTVLGSSVEGPIEVEEVEESNSSFGLQANSGATVPFSLGANAGIGGKNSQSLRYHKRPDQQLLISSGLEDRGTGLFIKLRRSDQFPLEGTHPVRITLRLPRLWRTGFIRLDCEAIVRQDSRLGDTSRQSVVQRRFLIPILIVGDEEARLKARAIQQAEGALRAAVIAGGERGKPDRWIQEIAQWAQPDKSPRLDAQWLERVTTTSPASTTAVRGNLPNSVAIAFKEFSRRKTAFVALSQPKPVASADADRPRSTGERSQ